MKFTEPVHTCWDRLTSQLAEQPFCKNRRVVLIKKITFLLAFFVELKIMVVTLLSVVFQSRPC
ncbi:hypothetical protein GCAAIG_02050 [Candidatus Electronema halotolerans]